MAKLFEEVINGSASSHSSADILIYFSCVDGVGAQAAGSPTLPPAALQVATAPGCGSAAMS
eukprot:6153036-Amphidinium_carterae.1